MQLKSRRRAQVAVGVAQLAASLFASQSAHAQGQTGPTQPSAPDTAYVGSAGGTAPGQSRADAAVLVYQEAGGRVRAIEPVTSVTIHTSDEKIISFGLTADALTGASPNGAIRSRRLQTFTTPVEGQAAPVVTTPATPGTTSTTTTTTRQTVTSASGKKTVVLVPTTVTTTTPGSPAVVQQQVLARQYTIDPGVLPVDDSFNDRRYAGNFNYSQQVGRVNRLGFGGNYSKEHDFSSFSGNANVSRDFNQRNTTVSLAVNYEHDKVSPYGGTPVGMSEMNGTIKGADVSRNVVDGVLGLTQVVTRNWLAQINVSAGKSKGYQNDPYRIISVVDRNGDPVRYLYENRPDSRLRKSVYVANKVALGRQIFDLSGRYFWDDWGVKSQTIEVSDRIALTEGFYIQPRARWYHQSAADFYRYYLSSTQATPKYASSDSRLGAFNSWTLGASMGLKVTPSNEVFLKGDYYKQSGDGHPAGAPSALASYDLFPAVKATSMMVGVTHFF